MALVGLGVDIVHIPRVARLHQLHGEKFLKKFLHPKEIEQFESISLSSKRSTFLASRWAAKEAAYKAFSRVRIPFPDFIVSKSDKGAPELTFEGIALEVSQQLDLGIPLISISHDTDYATATVILQKRISSL
jgi:holo-[acyl-carrier protein] synthase